MGGSGSQQMGAQGGSLQGLGGFGQGGAGPWQGGGSQFTPTPGGAMGQLPQSMARFDPRMAQMGGNLALPPGAPGGPQMPGMGMGQGPAPSVGPGGAGGQMPQTGGQMPEGGWQGQAPQITPQSQFGGGQGPTPPADPDAAARAAMQMPQGGQQMLGGPQMG